MRDIFDHIAAHLRREHHDLPDAAIQGFLRTLEVVRVEDMSCSQAFARLDEYVEKELHGQAAARLMPLLREHLDLCHDCSEEYEALLRVLQETANGETLR